MNEIDRLMMDALDHRLDADGMARLHALLDAHPAEREEFARLHAVEAGLSAIRKAAPPAHLSRTIMASIAAAGRAQRSEPRLIWKAAYIAGVMALLAVIALSAAVPAAAIAFGTGAGPALEAAAALVARGAFSIASRLLDAITLVVMVLARQPAAWAVLALSAGTISLWISVVTRAWRMPTLQPATAASA